MREHDHETMAPYQFYMWLIANSKGQALDSHCGAISQIATVLLGYHDTGDAIDAWEPRGFFSPMAPADLAIRCSTSAILSLDNQDTKREMARRAANCLIGSVARFKFQNHPVPEDESMTPTIQQLTKDLLMRNLQHGQRPSR